MSDKNIKVLVCGGRDYTKYHRVLSVLEEIHKHRTIGQIISGHARGADKLGERWAKLRKVDLRIFEVSKEEWELHGKKAGILRNQRMLEEGKPNLVVAFPGGRGTADMIERSKKAGVPVVRVEDIDDEGTDR